MASSDDSWASFPSLGIGKSQTMLAALSRVGAEDKTVLIACPMATVNAWAHQIGALLPGATVHFYGVSDVSGTKYRSFIEMIPKPGMAYTFDYLAKLPTSEWKQQNMSKPSFFLVALPFVEHLAQRFDQWFDFAVEDEYFPGMKMDKIREWLRKVSKSLVRISQGNN
jgi:hypothetical protein